MKNVKYVMIYLEKKLARIESNMEHNRSFQLKNEHTKILKSLSAIYNYIKETS